MLRKSLQYLINIGKIDKTEAYDIIENKKMQKRFEDFLK